MVNLLNSNMKAKINLFYFLNEIYKEKKAIKSCIFIMAHVSWKIKKVNCLVKVNLKNE
jgi:hypothetical protein